MRGGHDREGGQVGHGSNRGRADPRSSEQTGNGVQEAEEDDVPVDTASFLELVHQDEPEEEKTLNLFQFCSKLHT